MPDRRSAHGSRLRERTVEDKGDTAKGTKDNCQKTGAEDTKDDCQKTGAGAEAAAAAEAVQVDGQEQALSILVQPARQ